MTKKEARARRKEIKEQFKKVKKLLKSAIKTANKYGGKSVKVPLNPKTVKPSSVRRVEKLLDIQKNRNKELVKKNKYSQVKVNYYYIDNKGKKHKIGDQTIDIDIRSKYKSRNVIVKDFNEFLENAKRLETMGKIKDVRDVLSMARGETDTIINKEAETWEKFKKDHAEFSRRELYDEWNKYKEEHYNPLRTHKVLVLEDGKEVEKTRSLLGNPRVEVQQAKVEKIANRLIFALSENDKKVNLASKDEIDELIKTFEEYRTYYFKDEEINAMVLKMEALLVQIEFDVTNKVDPHFEDRFKVWEEKQSHKN